MIQVNAVRFLALATIAILSIPSAASRAEQPNVVVILTDDQGWGDLSLNGNTNLETPNIDGLARAGASFDRFFVCPVCSPTRAEFLTGRYHPRSGVYSTSAGGERMNLDEATIADAFRAAGYATAAFGKWHNGMQYPYHPNGRGFDEYYGFCSGHWGNYFSPPLEHNSELVQGNGFVVDDFTDHALSFIEQHKDQPFFAYLPLNTPHSPMQVPERWWKRHATKPLELHNRDPERENELHVRAALAMCENIDWNVGRINQKLDDLGLTDNTIVVYFCDNGPNGVRWNGGMKGRKGSTDEGGVRSPLIVRWPGKIAAGKQVSQIAAAIDLLPTLTALAGIDVVGSKPLDGLSLEELLVGESEPNSDRMIFSHWRQRVSVRTQQFRLDAQGKLFDMGADPGQDKDVSSDHPQVTEKLRSAVARFERDVVAGHDSDDRPFLVGHPAYWRTQLPARDGIAHGKIKRSNRFPNCSFFTNWSSLDDRITWDVEVGASGTYQVELYYSCRAADVGATLELSLGDSKVSAKVTEAHDPPLVGAEQDRVERIESYVKEFRPLALGSIELDQGRGELTLRALDIPGEQAIDFRLMMFTRVE